MTPHIRKLLSLPDDHHHPIDYPITTDTSTSTSSSSTPLLSKFEEREYQNPTTTNFTGYNNLKLSPPFDSAMALTVLVLLTALFFMGFFSIYIRRFADESSVDPTRRRRSRGSGSGSSDLSSTTSSLARSKKGVDPTMIESLPVHAYGGGGEKQGIKLELECAICLSEFEEREWVKEIPYCGHVFHVECIDMWLSSHVTCPLCRTAKLLPAAPVEEREKEKVVVEDVHVAVGEEEEEGERGLGVSEVQGDVESGGEREIRLVVDERDTCNREVGPMGERRSTSCSSWFGERITLHRSSSF